MIGRPLVVKVGGNEVDDLAWLRRLAQALGLEPQWREGLRVTTPASLRAVSMVLSGVVNKRLVSTLISGGLDAVGISGEDGALIRASVAQQGELGRIGEVGSVRVDLLQSLLARGITPVVSPVSRGPDGGPLNVNADDAAAAVATALGARELLFVSNVSGVLHEGAVLPRVAGHDAAEGLIADGVAGGGMMPKLRAACRAAEKGIERVRVGGLEMLENATAGTWVQAEDVVTVGVPS